MMPEQHNKWKNERLFIMELLGQLNRANGIKELMGRVTKLMRDWSGCDAVGIRLQEGLDYPYFETLGFPESFVEMENRLCIVDGKGNALKDENGNPVLECMCGNVICGRTNPSLPFFTSRGSFFTNSTSDLLASSSEADRQARTRNRCNGEGYESVALIPMRHGEQNIGLLQFNDFRRRRFTIKKIELLEHLASSLALGIVQRKTAEAHAKNEALLSSILEAVQDPIFVKDISLRYLKVNTAMSTLFERRPEDFYGKTDNDLFGRSCVFDIDAIDHKAFEGQTVMDNISATFLNTPRSFHTVITPLRNKEQTILGLCGVARDVTQRKQAEEIQTKNEQWLKTILKNLPCIVFAYDLEGRLIFLNDAASAETGYTEEELLGMNVTEIAPNCMNTNESKNFWHDMCKEDFITYKSTHKRKDGTEYMAEVYLNRATLDRQQIMLALAFDITERERAEIALREREKQFRLLIDNSPVAIFVQTKLKFAYVNRASVSLYGARTKQDLLGKSIFERLHPDYRSIMLDRIHLLNSRHQPLELVEQKHLKFNGEEITVLITAAPFVFKGNNSAIVFVNDTTDRKRVEQERDRLQEELLHARKMESVATMAGGIAHEFNNKLCMINLCAESVLEQLDMKHPAHHQVQEIINTGDKSAGLIKQLMGFARKQIIKPVQMALNPIISKKIEMYKSFLKEDIELLWRPGHDLWHVKMDPSQIDQIMTNLLSNSRDAITGNGQVAIDTENIILNEDDSEHDTDPGEYVMLRVSDNGCGMDTQTLARLFDPFFTTKPVGKNSGLGLPTIYGIVKQNQGFIRVESIKNTGSSFKIYIPRYTGEDTSCEDKSAPENHSLKGNETVLLVEDEPNLLAKCKLVLESRGYRVLSTPSAFEALRLADCYAGEIDLLFTDVVMPEMDGFSLCETILRKYPSIKCLFMSGHMDQVIAEKGVNQEEMNFIQKPFSIQALSKRIKETLSSKQEKKEHHDEKP